MAQALFNPEDPAMQALLTKTLPLALAGEFYSLPSVKRACAITEIAMAEDQTADGRAAALKK